MMVHTCTPNSEDAEAGGLPKGEVGLTISNAALSLNSEFHGPGWQLLLFYALIWHILFTFSGFLVFAPFIA